MAPHITDNDLERYALNRLAETEVARLEEHLLVCEECRERLAQWDAYIGAMGAAMRKQ